VLPARPLLSRRPHWRNPRRVRRTASGRSVYNYFRDYNPVIGRYAESDPVGLRGGINTYAYVADNPLNSADPSGLIVTGTWIEAPKFNIEDYGWDSTELISPRWSWWGYVKFLRFHGHASGFVNIDVKCSEDCNEWDIHQRLPVAARGHFDLGPNVYTLGVGALTSPLVGGALFIALAGGSLLQAEYHYLSLAEEKAGPLIAAARAFGATAICLGARLPWGQ
jgi:RHS repeat-associated protein